MVFSVRVDNEGVEEVHISKKKESDKLEGNEHKCMSKNTNQNGEANKCALGQVM